MTTSLTQVNYCINIYISNIPHHFKQYDFYKATKNITWGQGNPTAQLMFIGEAPGWKGCGKTGIPFYNDKSGMFFL